MFMAFDKTINIKIVRSCRIPHINTIKMFSMTDATVNLLENILIEWIICWLITINCLRHDIGFWITTLNTHNHVFNLCHISSIVIKDWYFISSPEEVEGTFTSLRNTM